MKPDSVLTASGKLVATVVFETTLFPFFEKGSSAELGYVAIKCTPSGIRIRNITLLRGTLLPIELSAHKNDRPDDYHRKDFTDLFYFLFVSEP